MPVPFFSGLFLQSSFQLPFLSSCGYLFSLKHCTSLESMRIQSEAVRDHSYGAFLIWFWQKVAFFVLLSCEFGGCLCFFFLRFPKCHDVNTEDYYLVATVIVKQDLVCALESFVPCVPLQGYPAEMFHWDVVAFCTCFPRLGGRFLDPSFNATGDNRYLFPCKWM